MHLPLPRSRSSLVLAALVVSACSSGSGGGAAVQPTAPQQPPFDAAKLDPLTDQQWHLKNIEAQAAWATATGWGVRLVVIDDGVMLNHEDLAANIVKGASVELNPDGSKKDDDPTPPTKFNPAEPPSHGTNCAGVAAAVGGNGKGGHGVAPQAGLVGVLDEGSVNSTAVALLWQSEANHIYSQSFGPTEDGGYNPVDPPIEATVRKGLTLRGGKGLLNVRSAGNGWQKNHHSNCDGYNNLFGVIIVASVNEDGKRPEYNQNGCTQTICAPQNLLTTDLPNSPQTNLKDNPLYTGGFTGTSSSTPLAAGVIALMLQANKDLTWRDVRRILAKTATQNDPTHPDWAKNAAGLNINHQYGYGTINAKRAVAMAKGFQSIGPANLAPVESALDVANVAIPDDNQTIITRTLDVSMPNKKIDQVNVRIELATENLRNLRILLVSPNGTESELLESIDPTDRTKNMDEQGNYRPFDPKKVDGIAQGTGVFEFATVRLMEESPNGTWKLMIQDQITGHKTTLKAWKLKIWAD